MSVDIWVAVLGALAAGLISPVLLTEYKMWRRERTWARPRKTRLNTMLKDKTVAPDGFRSLDRLCLETGMKKEECRTLLIEIGARGGMMTVAEKNVEGWTLSPETTT